MIGYNILLIEKRLINMRQKISQKLINKFCKKHRIKQIIQTINPDTNPELFMIKPERPSIPTTPKVVEDELPFIYTYYYEPIMDVNENIIIPLYFTDFKQWEYYTDTDFFTFKLRYQVDDGEPKYIEGLKAGDYNLNLGKLPEGTHPFNVEVTDQFGRTSWRLFKEVKTLNLLDNEITESQTYTITDADLNRYNINKNDSPVVDDMVNNKKGLTKLFREIRNNGYRKCILPKGKYRVNRCADRYSTDEDKYDTPIMLPSGLTVDMNESTFKMHPYDDREYGDKGQVGNLLVMIYDCVDTHIINGVLEGDYAERLEMNWTDGTNAIQGGNGEGDFGICFKGGAYNSMKNITITQITGYNVGSMFGSSGGAKTKWNTPIDGKDVDENGNLIDTDKLRCTIDTFDITEFHTKEDHYITASVWLAYGMPKGQEWDYKYSFYDKDMNFIESFNVQQFRFCRIPLNAKFARLTFKCTSEQADNLAIYGRPAPKYIEISDCEFIDNRTCTAPAQFHHLIIKDCNYTRSGRSITPCPIDLEDGWEQMQDFYANNVNVIESVGTSGIIINAGLNMVIENCDGLDIIARYRIHGLTIRNNTNCSITNSFGWMSKHSIRIYNNSSTGLGLDSTDHPLDQPILIKNNTFRECTLGFWAGHGVEQCLKLSKEYLHYKCNLIDISHNDFGKSLNCNVIRSTANLSKAFYQGGGEYFDCDFHTDDNDVSTYPFSSNLGEKSWLYCEHCTFHCPMLFKKHNRIYSTQFINCNFKKELSFNTTAYPENDTESHLIKFENCVFEGKVNLYPGRKIRFYFINCTFKNGYEITGNSYGGFIKINDEVVFDR